MPTELIELQPQHPSAKLDHAVSFASWLADGDSLSTATVTAGAGITVHDGSVKPAPAIDGSDVVFWLSGGTGGVAYQGAVAVTTADGREDTVEWQIQIIDPTP